MRLHALDECRRLVLAHGIPGYAISEPLDGERLLAAAESLEEALAPQSFDDERQGALDTVREIGERLIPKS